MSYRYHPGRSRSYSPRRSRPAAPEVLIEFPSAGATYNRPEYGVYEYSTYGRGSVLSGQERRSFLASFETLAEAKAAYPKATESLSCYRPPYLGHLPEEGDL